MKTIICLALCMLAVSAMSPVENLHSALDLLDMPNLLCDHKGFDLSASFTFLGGVKDDNNDVDESVYVHGTYNLLTYEDGKGKVKTGSFHKVKDFTSHGVVNFTGSGAFNARGGGADWEGYFNGGSSTDLAFETDSGVAVALREHWFDGHFKGKNSWGEGHVQVNSWQHGGNSSENSVNYNFGGEKDNQRYAGQSKGAAHAVVGSEEYNAFFSSVFHGVNQKDSWQVSGGWVVDAYNSHWENVWSKDGHFDKNGTCDEAFGTFRHFGTFGLPGGDLITE